MLVHDGSRVILWKFQHLAGVAHGEGERAGFAAVEAAEEYRHEEGGDLIVRDVSGDVGVDGRSKLLRGEGAPVAFGFDEREEIHAGRGAADYLIGIFAAAKLPASRKSRPMIPMDSCQASSNGM